MSESKKTMDAQQKENDFMSDVISGLGAPWTNEKQIRPDVCMTCRTNKYKAHRVFDNGRWECERCKVEIDNARDLFAEERPDLVPKPYIGWG